MKKECPNPDGFVDILFLLFITWWKVF